MPAATLQFARARRGDGEELPLAWWLVAAATAAALIIRIAFVGTQSLGYEEVFTRAIATQPSITGVWNAIRATESTPPLYYVLTWGWLKLAGSHGAGALRAVSLLAGVITVPVAFAATRRLLGARVAAAAAWLAAISPILVGYSLYARAYALLVLAGALSIWALAGLRERPGSWLRWIAWAASAVVCLWTHYFAVFLIAGEVAVLAFAFPRQRIRLGACLVAVAATTIPLWSLFSAQNGDSERTAYIAAESLGGRLEGVVRQFSMGTNVPTAWLEGAGIAVFVLAILYALVRPRRRRETLLLVVVAVIAAGIPIAGALTRIDDHLLARNLLAVWICVAPLAAVGLIRARAVPLALYSVLALATVIVTQTNWRYEAATDWNGSAALVRGQARGEPVAVMPGLELNVAGLYMQRHPLRAAVTTSDLWVMLEPQRGAGQRALNPVANPALATLFGAQLTAVGEVDHDGFRLIHLHSATPVSVPPAPAQNGSPSAPDALVLAP
ncbi:MAG TPA: glycosyltransferase family 39 protein [Solirubrobacteraceae bacterium]|nr:glycosyltransferase family 39 protein [Solirubrobacteraceae bacterium]